MRNVAPLRALRRRSRGLLQVGLLLLLAGVFFAFLGLALIAIPLMVRDNPGYSVYVTVRNIFLLGGIGGAILGVLVILRALTLKTDNPSAKRVGLALEQKLGDDFTFIRNVSKWSVGYIDAVLVGPPGVLVFRIVDQRGVFFNDGPKWLKQQDKGQWQPLRWNPTQDLANSIDKLHRYFANRGLDAIPIMGVVFFAHEPPDVQINAENPVLPSAHLGDFAEKLNDEYFIRNRIDPETATEIVRYLYTV